MPGYANSLITQQQAQSVGCPKCGARVGEACRDDVGERRLVQGQPQNHIERVRAARAKFVQRRH